eukprot:5495437-Amphidinium_carterae.1
MQVMTIGTKMGVGTMANMGQAMQRCAKQPRKYGERQTELQNLQVRVARSCSFRCVKRKVKCGIMVCELGEAPFRRQVACAWWFDPQRGWWHNAC